MARGGGGEGGLNRFYVATTLAFSSAVVYIRHLCSPREGFPTHQCNISENVKKSNKYSDETTMRTRQQGKKKKTKKKKTKLFKQK